MEVERVEKLRTKLQQEYPILSQIKKNESQRYSSVKSRKAYDFPVRPTFSKIDLVSMMKNSTKYGRIKDYQFPSFHDTNDPISIKAQQ